MASFRYEGLYLGGEKASGVVEAATQDEAIAIIRKTCSQVTMIKEMPRAISIGSSTTRAKVSPKSLALTCQQFGIILKAGLPLVQTVALVANQTADKGMKRVLETIAENIRTGWSLSHAIMEFGNVFPVTFRETIRAGEESGDLAASFERMSKYYEQSAKTRSKTISTLTYPSFVILVAAVVIVIIMGYAVPSFINTFESMGIELPLPTRILIAMTKFFSEYGLLVIGILFAFIVGCVVFSRTKAGAMFFSKLALSLPVIGSVVQMSGASQFAHTMSAMLASGMQILGAMDVSGKAVSSKVMSKEILGCVSGVEAGRTLGECLMETEWVPQMLVQMVGIGETSGSMESTLSVLADYYDNEVQVKSDRALALLEPMIICVLAVFVVLILFAVYLPMFSMTQGIG